MEDASRFTGFTITSDPDTTRVEPATRPDGEREGLGPVRVLYVADLHPARPAPDPEAGGHRRQLDGPEFAALLAEERPSVEVSVENHLGDGAERFTAVIEVNSMDALTPDGLAASVASLRRARAFRDAVDDARAGRIGRDELHQRLLSEAGMGESAAAALVQALTPRPPGAVAGNGQSTGDASLDRILGLIDLGTAAPPASPTDRALDAFIGAVASSQPSEVDPAAAGRIVTDVDTRLGAQIDAILNDPEVRRLEQAWRGLKFLVDRADFRGGLRLEVLAASKADLADVLHHEVLWPEHEHGAERPPLAAIVVGHDFGHTPPEIAALENLSATGASLQVPIVASVDAAFFGFEQPTDLSRLPVLRQHLATGGYIGYHKLRENPDSSFLALAAPSFLLRGPHALSWGAPETGYLWGGGALLVAAALLKAHARTGWPTRLADQRVEDLPVRRTRMGGIPLAASFSDRHMADFADMGIFAFRGPLNRDHAEPGYPAAVQRPDRNADPADARAQATLPAAVFSALSAHRILCIQDELAGALEEQATAELERRLRSFLGAPDDADAVTVQYLSEHDTDDTRVFGARLRPPKSVLPYGVGVILGANVSKHVPA